MIFGNENELIKACVKGNTEAQMQLYKMYSKEMYNVALRILHQKEDAEDIMQNAFIAAFSQIQNVRNESGFKAWLKRITINKAIDEYKKRTKIIITETENFIELSENFIELSDNFVEINEETIQPKTIVENIAKLPEIQQLLIELFYFQELTHQEIAEKLSISYENSRIILYRAKEKLKKLLQNESKILG